MKELEDANYKLGIELISLHEIPRGEYPNYDYIIKQILNLKGDGWRIAIVDPEIYGANPAYKRVIWQAEE